MAFVSLYRKYRSQTFGDLVGQGHVVKTLQNALASNRYSHAYLFTGPRGTGKTSTARLLAKALCCEHGPSAEPCNECWICQEITAGASMDVVEIDAASESGVDEVREKIVEKADYQPSGARFKVFIIDEVHDLSPKAFDALLKTIEEPPPHLIFVLATTEFNKVPRTIQSRCQKFEFHRGSVHELIARLEYVAKEEGIVVEAAALMAMARMADGGFRDALTLLEQATLTAEGTITVSHVYSQFGWVDDAQSDAILLGIADRDIPGLLETLGSVFGSGRDPRSVVESLIFRLAAMTEVLFVKPEKQEADASFQAALHEAAARIGAQRLLALRGQLAETHRNLRDISLPRLWLESEFLRMASETQGTAATADKGSETRHTPAPTAAVRSEEAKATEVKRSTNEPKPLTEEVVAIADPTPSGDESLDRGRDVWHATVKELAGISKTMAMKLASTQVKSLAGNRLEVLFERKIELDALIEGPKGDQRRQAILEVVRRHAGEPWDVVYMVGQKSNGEASMPAVELPVEGERLVELAKDVLGGI